MFFPVMGMELKKNIKDKINKFKCGSFSGGLWHEAKSAHAWREGVPSAKKKFSLRKLLSLLLKGPFSSASSKVAHVFATFRVKQPVEFTVSSHLC